MPIVITNRTLNAKFIEMTEAINNAKTQSEHGRLISERRGLQIAAEILGFSTGQMLMDADMHYLDQGIDRPMCGGVWLDWEVPDAAPR